MQPGQLQEPATPGVSYPGPPSMHRATHSISAPSGVKKIPPPGPCGESGGDRLPAIIDTPAPPRQRAPPHASRSPSCNNLATAIQPVTTRGPFRRPGRELRAPGRRAGGARDEPREERLLNERPLAADDGTAHPGLAGAGDEARDLRLHSRVRIRPRAGEGAKPRVDFLRGKIAVGRAGHGAAREIDRERGAVLGRGPGRPGDAQ